MHIAIISARGGGGMFLEPMEVCFVTARTIEFVTRVDQKIGLQVAQLDYLSSLMSTKVAFRRSEALDCAYCVSMPED